MGLVAFVPELLPHPVDGPRGVVIAYAAIAGAVTVLEVGASEAQLTYTAVVDCKDLDLVVKGPRRLVRGCWPAVGVGWAGVESAEGLWDQLHVLALLFLSLFLLPLQVPKRDSAPVEKSQQIRFTLTESCWAEAVGKQSNFPPGPNSGF